MSVQEKKSEEKYCTSHEKEKSELDWSSIEDKLFPEVIIKRNIGGFDKETRGCDIVRFDDREEL